MLGRGQPRADGESGCPASTLAIAQAVQGQWARSAVYV
jgi:hypothetical protein